MASVEQWGCAGLPEGTSDCAPHIGNLWVGSWIAAIVIGVFVQVLMGWAAVRCRPTPTLSAEEYK